jgi:hypothetical protein
MNYFFKDALRLITALLFILIFVSCSMTTPINATGYAVGSKTGTAKATGYLGIFVDGDASIRTAAKNGGISRISSVDVKKTNIAFIVMTYETIVTGE